jgi:hypothetical protein
MRVQGPGAGMDGHGTGIGYLGPGPATQRSDAGWLNEGKATHRMIGFLRLAVFAFIGLSVVYLVLRIYARSLRREALEREFDAGGIAGTREHHVAAGLARYEGSLRRRLLWLVYIIPMALMAVTIYLVNYH